MNDLELVTLHQEIECVAESDNRHSISVTSEQKRKMRGGGGGGGVGYP